MKLGVIGEPCMDYIHRGEETTKKQFGGILYSIVSLAVISRKSAEVYPVMNLGEDEYDNVTAFLKEFKNIKTYYINKSKHNTRIVNLLYKDKPSVLNSPAKKTYDREENSTEPTLPVEYEQIKEGLKQLDGILVNMVSGVDITLGSFKKIRENFSGYIHMDLHNLVMQTFPDGTRKQFHLIDWSNWCSLCDTLQMNESEICVLTGDNLTEFETAERILANGRVKSVVVTRGIEGVSLYQMKSVKLNRTDIPSIDNPNFIDSTGCGDVFAASFFYKNLENNMKDFGESLNFANRMASENTSLNGVEDLNRLSQDLNG